MLTDTLFLVRPARFGYDAETAASNAFQAIDPDRSPEEIQRLAVKEFDGFADRLRQAGIRVIVGEDSPEPAKPNAVFPNNWVSFHADGTVITYPMATASRRLERREAFIDQIGQQHEIKQRVHLERSEQTGQFLEGTGSLVLDRDHRIAYACESVRTHPDLVQQFCQQFNYRPVLFQANDPHGQSIYHTNVLMALGEEFVVICLEAVREADREKLLAEFARTRKNVVAISMEQMAAYAGNMLQVKNQAGESFLLMSEQAYLSLNEDQVHRLKEHARLLFAPIYTIEKAGGGSARCMLAEVFLPKR